MSIYSGSSPFSRGKLGGAKGIGMKMSRGGAKKRFRLVFASRSSNVVTRTGTSSVNKGNTVLGLGNSGQGLIRNAATQSLTSDGGGFLAYDGFGIVAGGGDPVLYLTCSCGTDFASAAVAFAGKKKIKPTFSIDGVDYVGILDTGSFSARGYKVVFPQLTSLFSLSAGTSTGFKIEFTT